MRHHLWKWHFQSLSQQPGEKIREFSTRVLQAATDCNYICTSCNTDLTDEHARDQMMIGLANQTLQKETMCRDESLTSFYDVVRYCVAYEATIADQSNIRQDSSVAATNTSGEYSSASASASMTPAPPVTATSVPAPSVPAPPVPSHKARSYKPPATGRRSVTQPCRGCGANPPHLRTSCPAWGKTCNNCKRPNHFSAVCQSSTRSDVAHVSWDPDAAVFKPAAPTPLPSLDAEI